MNVTVSRSILFRWITPALFILGCAVTQAAEVAAPSASAQASTPSAASASAAASGAAAPLAATGPRGSGARGRGRGPALPADPNLPTLWIIGDSTVNNPAGGQRGWGTSIAAYFDAKKINVVNRAVSGTSSRTFYTGQWKNVLPQIKKGDFLLLQFGHNDANPLNDDSRARGTIPGIGDQSEEIDNILTKQHEVVHSFGWYEKQYVAEAREKGATPMVCSFIPRKIWDAKTGLIVRANFATWAGQVATEVKAPFVDIDELVARQYDAMGKEKTSALFGPTPEEHTHTTPAGAELNARTVVAALKGLKDNPLVPLLAASATDIAPLRTSDPAPAPAKVEAPSASAPAAATAAASAK